MSQKRAKKAESQTADNLPVKRKAGRPPTFNEQIADKIVALAEKGKTIDQISDIIGVTSRCISFWLAEKPSLLQAVKEARQMADEMVEASLFKKATGYFHETEKIFYDKDTGQIVRAPTVQHYAPDTTAQIFWLKNRKPEQWRDRTEVKLEKELDDMSDEELITIVQSYTKEKKE